jgi:hypothetical protein
MDDCPIEEIGHCGKSDMWMGPHIDTLSGHQFSWTHLVEKNERPDHLALRGRKHAPYLETTQLAGTRYDDGLNGFAPRCNI